MSPRRIRPLAAVWMIRPRKTRPSVITRWAIGLRCAIAVGMACLAAGPACQSATAALVIDPSGGQLLTNGTNLYAPNSTDALIPLPLASAFGGKFFGQTTTQPIFASDNGNLNFTGNTNFFPNRDNTVARISPLWDDFLFAQDENGIVNNRIVWEHRQGAFLAVSWLNVRLDMESAFEATFPSTDRSFQTLWFEADTLIRGFDFKADDIVFSYVAHVAGTGDFGDLFGRVSLDKGDGNGTDSPGTTAFPAFSDFGEVLAEDGENFPGRNDDFLLFRWNPTNGNYDVSIQSFTAVPEPSSLLMIATIALLGAATANRRGKRNIAAAESV
jgi:hypothetical protein